MSSANAETLEAGETVGGKYRIVRPLGVGGMAQVYEAEHLGLERRVALKMLAQDVATHEGVRHRFQREARAVAQIESPHVARVLDIDIVDEHRMFIVLELLRGRDLNEELDVRAPLPVAEACDYVRQAAVGMAAAHALGIVHRDLKPANLFLCDPEPPAERRVVKVLDFGISKIEKEDDRRITRAREAFGTPQYMSPEQIRGARDVDGRSDVWALGVVLYECLTGRPPYDGDPTSVIAAIVTEGFSPARELNPNVPPELDDIISKALARDPEFRYASVLELEAALAPFAPPPPSLQLSTPHSAFAPISLVQPVTPPSEPRVSIAPPSAPRPTSAAPTVVATETSESPAAPNTSRKKPTWLLAAAALFVVAVGIWVTRASHAPLPSPSEPAASITAPAPPVIVPETPSVPQTASQPAAAVPAPDDAHAPPVMNRPKPKPTPAAKPAAGPAAKPAHEAPAPSAAPKTNPIAI